MKQQRSNFTTNSKTIQRHFRLGLSVSEDILLSMQQQDCVDSCYNVIFSLTIFRQASRVSQMLLYFRCLKSYTDARIVNELVESHESFLFLMLMISNWFTEQLYRVERFLNERFAIHLNHFEVHSSHDWKFKVIQYLLLRIYEKK